MQDFVRKLQKEKKRLQSEPITIVWNTLYRRHYQEKRELSIQVL
jgi:hypothetical protein